MNYQERGGGGICVTKVWLLKAGKVNCTLCALQLAGAPLMLTFNSFEEDLGRGERNLKVLKLLCVLWRKV